MSRQSELVQQTQRIGAGLFDIDASGRVLMPNQPAFAAYSVSSAVRGTTGTLPLEQVVLNVGGHYNTSTYTFTAPVSGTYRFIISCLIASGAHVTFRKNGAYPVGGGGQVGIHQVGASYARCAIEVILDLSAGDTMTAHQDNTNGVYMDWSMFTGHLIG